MTNLTDTQRDMWADVYRLRDKYANMGDTPEEWCALYNEAHEIAAKYDNCHEVIRLIVDVYNTLEVERNHIFDQDGWSNG